MYLEIDIKAPPQTYKERIGLEAVGAVLFLCHPLLYGSRELPLYRGKNWSCLFLSRLSNSNSPLSNMHTTHSNVCTDFISNMHIEVTEWELIIQCTFPSQSYQESCRMWCDNKLKSVDLPHQCSMHKSSSPPEPARPRQNVLYPAKNISTMLSCIHCLFYQTSNSRHRPQS